MNRGVLLFAYNNGLTDYYTGAVWTTKRINYFLNLPVTLVTDKATLGNRIHDMFDNVILTDVDYDGNTLNKKLWMNKGRFRAYELSPYDSTLVLDVDYIVNSKQLLTLFDINSEFLCHNKIRYLCTEVVREPISQTSFDTLWATVLKFDKTKKCEQLFKMIQVIEENYEFYGQLHKFHATTYRNDYALTFAHRIVNGHYNEHSEYIPWSLLHVGKHIDIQPESNKFSETSFKLVLDNRYIKVKDCDIHVLNKHNFTRLVGEMND